LPVTLNEALLPEHNVCEKGCPVIEAGSVTVKIAAA